jgi:hypothetical protein
MKIKDAIILALCSVVVPNCLAATITFGSESLSLTPSTPYDESGFRLVATVGNTACLIPVQSTTNSFFALACLNVAAVNDTVQLRLISGGAFTFSSIDVGGLAGGSATSYDSISIFGSLNNNPVGSMLNIRPTIFLGFSTLLSTISGPVDLIEFRFAEGSTFGTAFDNIVVTPVDSQVPEPSFAVLGAATLAGFCLRSRKSRIPSTRD